MQGHTPSVRAIHADPRAFLLCNNRTSNPHLENWSVPVRVGRAASAHIFTDERRNQNLKRGSDLSKVTQLKMCENQLPN